MILSETIHYLLENQENRLKELTITKLVMGKQFTAVMLSDGSCGLAAAEIPEKTQCSHGKIRIHGEFAPGNFKGNTVYKLFSYEDNDCRISFSVKLAVINAISEKEISNGKYHIVKHKDTLEVLDIGSLSKVTVVGAFHSYIKKLAETGCILKVLELNEDALSDEHKHFFVPVHQAESILSESDIVIITGSTLVNETLDDLLGMIKNNAQIAVIGPSSSLFPDVLFDRGVTIIGATVISDKETMFRIISEGGSGYHLFEKCAYKICITN